MTTNSKVKASVSPNTGAGNVCPVLAASWSIAIIVIGATAQTSRKKRPACKWIDVIIRGGGHHNPRAEYCAGRQSDAD